MSISWLRFDSIGCSSLNENAEHEMLLLLKQLKLLSNPFRMKLLLLLLDVEEEVAVVEELSQGVFILGMILEMDLLA